jgi:hypothetical protein
MFGCVNCFSLTLHDSITVFAWRREIFPHFSFHTKMIFMSQNALDRTACAAIDRNICSPLIIYAALDTYVRTFWSFQIQYYTFIALINYETGSTSCHAEIAEFFRLFSQTSNLVSYHIYDWIQCNRRKFSSARYYNLRIQVYDPTLSLTVSHDCTARHLLYRLHGDAWCRRSLRTFILSWPLVSAAAGDSHHTIRQPQFHFCKHALTKTRVT